MSKDNNKYVMFQTLRKGKNNDGVCLQVTPTKNGELLFTLAPQIGIENNLPKFDYKNAYKFGLSDLESAEIALYLERILFNGFFDFEIKYPHITANEPKTIAFKSSVYNNNLQIQLSVFPANNPNKRPLNIFLNEKEIYCIMINLKESLSLYQKKNYIDNLDTDIFKHSLKSDLFA